MVAFKKKIDVWAWLLEQIEQEILTFSGYASICRSVLISQTHFFHKLGNKLADRSCASHPTREELPLLPLSNIFFFKSQGNILIGQFKWHVSSQTWESLEKEKLHKRNDILRRSEEQSITTTFLTINPWAPAPAISPWKLSKPPFFYALPPSFQHHQNLPALCHIFPGPSSLLSKRTANSELIWARLWRGKAKQNNYLAPPPASISYFISGHL